MNGDTTDLTETGLDGNFSFCLVPHGAYTLAFKTNYKAGGVNSTDALKAAKHFVGFDLLSGLRLLAADVNGDSAVNAIDAMLMQQRFAGIIQGFSVEGWIFENPAINVTSDGNVNVTIRGICAGDVNASYILPSNVSLGCGDTITDSRDGQKYPTVQIGGQCWLQKNLNIGTMIDSLPIPTNNDTIEKWCYRNDPALCSIYGGLYDWDEMMQYSQTPGAKGICPEGTHLPTVSEWVSLKTFLGNSSGLLMKETGSEHWLPDNNNATNVSGFTALGAGMRNVSGTYSTGCFTDLKEETQFWPSKKYMNSMRTYARLFSDSSGLIIHILVISDKVGYSVRCIKD
jgi:uncharacterized protein (TIGR02145 family)